MIPRINTVLGDDPRTDGGWTSPSRSGGDDETRPRPNVGDMDPFRPAIDVDDDANHDDIEMDHVFGILENQRRRYVLKYLSTTERTIPLSDLTEQVAAWESNEEPRQLTSRDRQRVCVSLHHCHLPKMAASSAISYDQERNEIEHGERFDLFSHYLRREE